MTWSTIDDAATEFGVSRRTLERRVSASELPAYLNEHGVRMVWIRPLPSDAATLLAILRDEIHGLRQELSQASKAATAPVAPRPARQIVSQPEPKATTDRVAPPPTDRVAGPGLVDDDVSRDDLLELMARVWTGTDKELEKAAGVSQAWVNKQRRAQAAGKPAGIKAASKAARMRVLAVLQQAAGVA